MWQAYNWDLWAVAYIAYFGCSDGNFEEFRSWLISCGKNNFEQCLVSTEFAAGLVADYFPAEAVGEEAEKFYVAPKRIFEKRFGIPVYDRLEPSVYQYGNREPTGTGGEESEIADRYPSVFRILNRQTQESEPKRQ